MQYDFSDFDDGKEFVNPSHLYTLDLDVFGEHSLFQYINRTATPIGKLHLANWFNAHLENKEAIEHRQEAIHELSTDLEYRQQIRLLGLLYEGKPADTTEIKEWANSPSYYRKRTLLRILPTAVTIINFLCIGLAILGIISAGIAGGVFVGFVLFSTIFSKGITKLQTTYGEKLQILSTYADQILLTEQKRNAKSYTAKVKNGTYKSESNRFSSSTPAFKTDERARSTKQSANKHDTQWTDILGAAPSDANREVERNPRI